MPLKPEGTMGLPGALALGVGAMIGAGIFVLSGYVAGQAGPGAIVSFLLAAVAVSFTALTFAELSSAFAVAGGPYVFVREALGDWPGFIVGWSLWIGLSLACAFYSLGFGHYWSLFLPAGQAKTWGILLLIVLGILNFQGAKQTSRLQNITTGLLVGILMLFVVIGLPRIDTDLHKPFLPYGWRPILEMTGLVFVSYLGFELITAVAEDIRSPAVNVPWATFLSLTVVVAIYSGVLYVATGVKSYVDLGQTTTPIADVAYLLVGRPGRFVVAGAGLLAAISSANASLMACSRIVFAMARDGLLPQPLSTLEPKSHSPRNGLLATMVVVLLAIAITDFTWLAAVSGFLHLYPFILINGSLLLLRKKPTYQPGIRLRIAPVCAWLGIISCSWLLTQSSRSEVAGGLALLLPGVLYFAVSKRGTGI